MPLRPQCLPSTLLLPHCMLHQAVRCYTTSAPRAEVANYYKTLGLDSNASAGAIKKYYVHTLQVFQILISPRQFYSLSKTHHPDHNPSDPDASNRFVKISEAYTVLGNPQKRATYDADIQRTQRPSTQSTTPRGSHSSSSAPFGSRPASGLNTRRTRFKGPPPSFYRSGGWGVHSEKRRQAQAEGASAASPGKETGGGLGHGQGRAGWNDVLHFDQEGHYRTQEQQDLRRKRRLQNESVEYGKGGSMLARFVLISAVVGFAFWIPTLIEGFDRRPENNDDR